MTFSSILDTVVDNGRVLSSEADPSKLNAFSLTQEICFEAREQGLSVDEIDQAIQFALAHSDHDNDI